jgi:hypothetical protein
MGDMFAKHAILLVKNVLLTKFVYIKKNMNKSILGVGNAIVDVFCHVDEEFLKENNLIKGSMKLINKDEFNTLKKKN